MSVQVVQMFLPTVLTTSAATLYTVPALSSSAVLGRGRIRFTNTSGSPATVTAFAVPSGGSEGSGNNFCPSLTVPPNNNLDLDVPVIAGGGFIQALASTGGVITIQSLDGVLFA
jgi:hypothetical protein